MMFMKISTLVSCILLFVGCSTFKSPRAGAFFRLKSKAKHLRALNGGVYKTPCIHLPFIDKNFPEFLGDVIRLHNPKVDPVGAYKISRMLVKREGKQKTHVIDTSSVKLCRLGDEMGYSFRAISIRKNKHN